MTGKKVKEIQAGDRAEFSKTISESDIYLYAGITGDFNPAHINQSYAEKTFFQSRIAHGLLSAGFISTVIATKLPGPGTIYIKQELNFTAPVYIGDTITAFVEVIEVSVPENSVILKTICKNQKNEVVIDGKALVSPPKA
ncbi:MAG: MaoC family dehydratase [Deltaproteobacteria bacterium]|nr:MaoC family dehydratase [Deltaproteobacteria bacterium]MBW2053545.1 MaoC family dehydratase [Deltaproteobacteria bacterium]MBW2117092.1 MaoC family dehydratase [Deltaproteobacteria bacterium]MBW2346102.1 MaoC family dehydratase [Deltaproteobacteria bacterium]